MSRRQLVISLVLAAGGIACLMTLLNGGEEGGRSTVGQGKPCVGCHDSQAGHAAVPGHPRLTVGCAACHQQFPPGGLGGRAQPSGEDKHATVYTRLEVQIACIRCHSVGAPRIAPAVARGQQLYLESGCPGCHLPGGIAQRGRSMSVDLEGLTGTSLAKLAGYLVDPQKHAASTVPLSGGRRPTMWSLRDPTYRGRFADTKRGRKNLEALAVYVMTLADHPGRAALAQQGRATHPSLAACGDCHGRDRPKGAPPNQHACRFLASTPYLRCEACHQRENSKETGRAASVPSAGSVGNCPQVAAAVPLCRTCHFSLREHPDDRNPSVPFIRAPQ